MKKAWFATGILACMIGPLIYKIVNTLNITDGDAYILVAVCLTVIMAPVITLIRDQ